MSDARRELEALEAYLDCCAAMHAMPVVEFPGVSRAGHDWASRQRELIDAALLGKEYPRAEAFLARLLDDETVRTSDLLARSLACNHRALATRALRSEQLTGDMIVGTDPALVAWLDGAFDRCALGAMTKELWDVLWRYDMVRAFRSYPLALRERVACEVLAHSFMHAYDMNTTPRETFPMQLLRALLELPAFARVAKPLADAGFKCGDRLFTVFIAYGIARASAYLPAWAAEHEGFMQTLEFVMRAPENQTPERVQAAILMGHRQLAVVRLLTERYGADPCADDHALLMLAARDSQVDVVRYLLTTFPRTDVRAHNSAALVYAARRGCVDLTTILLAAGSVPTEEALTYASQYAASPSMSRGERERYATVTAMLRSARAP